MTAYLAANVRDYASGRAEAECLENHPHDVYFAGNLRPRPIDVAHDDFLYELIAKLAPSAFGAEVGLLPSGEEVAVQVELRWACYYRVFPTLDQQRSRQTRADEEEAPDAAQAQQPTDEHEPPRSTPAPTAAVLDEDEQELESEEDQRVEEESPEVVESAQARARGRRPTDRLYVRFRKVPCTAAGSILLCRDEEGCWNVDHSALQTALDAELERAKQVALADPERARTSGPPDEAIRVPDDSLASPAAYEAFLRSLDHDIVPEWAWDVNTSTRGDESEPHGLILAVEFINASPPIQHRNVEPFFFDAEASFGVEGADLYPFELELAPQGFRYDRHVWGRGFNCAVDRDDAPPNRLRTTHTPIYAQARYLTREQPSAPFGDLAGDPVPVLEHILTAMEAYREEWERARADYAARIPGWETHHEAAFERDRATFEQEIEAFRRGLELIRDNEDVRLAFRLTNETFLRLGQHPRKPKTAWRLFQIVFLVGQLPSIVALQDGGPSDEREHVDIIYFPTGGGKTEAYLGVIVFHCFFDRLRGKTAGVTAWTRFPLRLLTLQQTQRMADAIGVAELVRRTQRDPRLVGEGIDPFAVGYFVGQGGSPNDIVDVRSYQYARPEHQAIWSTVNDPDARQRWQRVVTCPACRTSSVRVDFDPDSVRLLHRCTNPNCAFPNGEIPVYVVDNEIYRYLPSVIVGTIDKLAGLGNQRKFALLLGHATGRCARHGYYASRCCQKECEWRPTERRKQGLDLPAPEGISGPTLFVQDELHLLKEGLGTFDGHYETFAQELRRQFGQDDTLKVIASSATIEAFDRQVEHLYGRSRTFARVFPGPGPTLGHSFYARTLDYPQRLFIGLLPHNKTIFNAILELIERYHREVQRLQSLAAGEPNPYGGALAPGSDAWRSLLDHYATSLTYFLATRELDAIHTDLLSHTNGLLAQDGLHRLDTHELRGETGTAEVAVTLDHLEQEHPAELSKDAVLATSMVSHGVDVDRLNAMIFYGMPRQTAEYIQASSRVGRAHIGLVFTCLHPARERDRSHYTYFQKYHEFLGQLVEPVAINRWATYSVDRTLPGLFMGVLLQLLANFQDQDNPNRYYMREHVANEITAGRITPDDFIPVLEKSYLAFVGEGVDANAYRAKIRRQVETFLYDQILSSNEQWVSESFTPHRPMRSLRDVDEAIPIELDRDGSNWSRHAGRPSASDGNG